MPMTIIGIDPGSQKTGWGVVSGTGNSLRLVDCGLIRAAGGGEFSLRLACIYNELRKVMERCRPDSAAIEDVFMSRNPMSALKLGQARGAAVAACASLGIHVSDYPPTAVKQAIVGAGRADKEQVAYMVGRLLKTEGEKWALDTSDALAVAICHLSMCRFRKKVMPQGGICRI